MSKRIEAYRTSGEVEKWIERCGFSSNQEAAAVMGIGWRQMFRWRQNGLPKGLHGRLLAERMHEIEHGLSQKKKR